MWKSILSFLGLQIEEESSDLSARVELLEDLILDIAGDGDCLCRDSIVECVKSWHPEFTDHEIMETIAILLKDGALVQDSKGHMVNPEYRPNTADRMKNGHDCI